MPAVAPAAVGSVSTRPPSTVQPRRLPSHSPGIPGTSDVHCPRTAPLPRTRGPGGQAMPSAPLIPVTPETAWLRCGRRAHPQHEIVPVLGPYVCIQHQEHLRSQSGHGSAGTPGGRAGVRLGDGRRQGSPALTQMVTRFPRAMRLPR